MTSLNFFEQLEREIEKAKRDAEQCEMERVRASNVHQAADKAANQINNYLATLEDTLIELNSITGRKPVGLRPESR